jgi:opacity protein-like surface antigen
MKKLLLISSVVASLLSSAASAKTSGSYLGVDAIRGSLRFKEVYTDSRYPNGNATNDGFSNSGYGVGISYKYAYNFKGAYLAPGVFAEQYNIAASRHNTPADLPQKLQVNNRYGAKLDFGYDVTNYFAPYVTGGYSGIRYKSTNYNTSGSTTITNHNIAGNAGSWFFGAGLKFDVSKNVSISAEYTTQNFRARTAIPNDTQSYSGHYKSRLDVAKVGVAYKF